jgi:hypothetical protein
MDVQPSHSEGQVFWAGFPAAAGKTEDIKKREITNARKKALLRDVIVMRSLLKDG